MNSKLKILFCLAALGTLTLSGCTKSEPEKKKEYATISVVDGTGGGTYEIGTEATITADVKTGKTFKEWVVDSAPISTDNPYTFTVTKNEEYVATYSSVKVNVTVINGSGTGQYDYGSDVTVTANVALDEAFVNWTIDNQVVSTSQTYTFTATSDVTIKANVKKFGKMASCTQTLTMTGDEFVVLNLTDIQLHDGNSVDFTKEIMDSCFEYKKPDLITVLGDILNDSPNYDVTRIAPEIFDLIESYEVPWAPIFGNHDQAHYQDSSMSIRTIGSEELSVMLSNKTRYPHCLYLPGPEEVEGLSNYMINVENVEGDLVESFILLDSLKHGLNNTHVKFYEDCVNSLKELNNNQTVPTVLFDHIPLPEYESEFDRFSEEEYYDVNGCCGVKPISNNNTSLLFPKFKELGSTKTMICGHDHYNSYFTEKDGITLAYALKSSQGDDEGGNQFKYSMGGCFLTVDGVHKDKIEYHRYNDYEYTVEANIKAGFDYHISLLPSWRSSGAKLKFNIRLPESGTVMFNLQGTNMMNKDYSNAIGSWNRLTEHLTIDASKKTVTNSKKENVGTLTLVKDDLYQYELDLMDIALNTSAGEAAHGDETLRNVYFHHNDMEYGLSNIHFEFEEVTETDQIDLSNAVISSIDDQVYPNGVVSKPEVTVTLNGQTLKEFEDIAVRYSNNREIGVAKVEVTPSGKGAHKYKGSVSATFNIIGNPYRGERFGKGSDFNLGDIPLTETFVFDIRFDNSAIDSSIWFFLGDGWDDYFGYYEIKGSGKLGENYAGMTIQAGENGYYRITCVLSQLNKANGGNKNPTEKINKFYFHGAWGAGTPTGYIDFNVA